MSFNPMTLGAGIGSLFGASKADWTNPATDAMKYLNQVPGTIKPYYQPYINAGQQALGSLQSQYQQLLNNPTAMFQNWGKQFQQSPGFQFSVDQATKAANQAAAAGGMAGTPQEQAELAKTVTGLADQDYYNYLDRIMGLYGQGLGVAQGINQMGYGASNELAQSLANNLGSQSQLSYAGTNAQNQYNAQQAAEKGGGWGSLIGLGAKILFGL